MCCLICGKLKLTALKKNIEIIEVQSDLGAGTRGSGFAAVALQKFATTQKSSLFADIPQKTSFLPVTNGFSSSHAQSIETIVKTCQHVCDEVSGTLFRGRRPIVISGDHSIAAGTIAGIKQANPDSVLGVVWIDAHADLHSPFTTPSGNMHGMSLAASIGEDNTESSNRKIDASTRFYWEKYKNIGNISPKLNPENVVYISLRDFEKEEAHLIAKHGIQIINTCSFLNFGTERVVEEIFATLKHCTDIYVSFDVDCLDASISKGTGLPVMGGLMPWEAGLLASLLMKNPKVICFEITEFNTFLDVNNETIPIVYNILEKGITAMQKHQVNEDSYSENISV